jgi:hypothetical protein
MGKPQPPEPPDPKETSAASTGTNVSTAIANNMMGMIDQTTPDGSIEYEQKGNYWWRDPFTDKLYKVPTFKATTTLSPEAKQLHASNMASQTNLAETAEQQSDFLKGYLGEQVDMGAVPDSQRLASQLAGGLSQAFGDDFQGSRADHQAALMQRMQPLLDRDREALETRLANQGIGYGTKAWKSAMSDHTRAVNDARLGAITQAGDEQRKFADTVLRTGAAEDASRAQAIEQQFALRNQPINEITALLSGSQLQTPQFGVYNPGNIPITDNARIIDDVYKGELNAYGTQAGMYNTMMGGFLGLLGSAISDIRLKTDLTKIGDVRGLGVYAFRYLWDAVGTTRVGHIAQEVLQSHPEAVIVGDTFLAVDYAKLEALQ